MVSDSKIAELAIKVESMIEKIRNGYSTEYHTFKINEDTDDEETVTIRVADHQANPQRISGKTIIFIVEGCEKKGSHISKKDYHVPGAIYIGEENKDESGYDIEYLLDYELN